MILQCRGVKVTTKINCLWLKMAESESAKHAFKPCLFYVKKQSYPTVSYDVSMSTAIIGHRQFVQFSTGKVQDSKLDHEHREENSLK